MMRIVVTLLVVGSAILGGCAKDSPGHSTEDNPTSSGDDVDTGTKVDGDSDTDSTSIGADVCAEVPCGLQTSRDGVSADCGKCRWLREIVDSKVAKSPAIAVNDEGAVDVVFVAKTGLLHGRRQTDGQWGFNDVDLAVIWDDYPIPNNNPVLVGEGIDKLHLVYVKGNPLQVNYAVFEENSWTITTVGAGDRAAMAIGSDGTPHVSWVSDTGGVLYATGNGPTWESTTLESRITEEAIPSIALGVGNVPHVSWCEYNSSYSDTLLQLAILTGDRWFIDSIADSNCSAIRRTQIRIDSAGNPVFAFINRNRRLSFAFKKFEVWQFEPIDYVDIIASRWAAWLESWSTDFELSPSDQPYAVFAVDSLWFGEIYVLATRSDNGWSTQPIADAFPGDLVIDMAVGPHNIPHVVYENGHEQDINYMVPVDAYPNDHDSICESVAKKIQSAACECDAQCCVGYLNYSTQSCCEDAGCWRIQLRRICGDPTNDPSLIQQCGSALGEAQCDVSYLLPDACYYDHF